MRRIEVLHKLYVRFPRRDAEFDLGFELGTLAVRMAQGERRISARLGRDAAEPVRVLAERFGYRMTVSPDRDSVDVMLHHPSIRPQLRLVAVSS